MTPYTYTKHGQTFTTGQPSPSHEAAGWTLVPDAPPIGALIGALEVGAEAARREIQDAMGLTVPTKPDVPRKKPGPKPKGKES